MPESEKIVWLYCPRADHAHALIREVKGKTYFCPDITCRQIMVTEAEKQKRLAHAAYQRRNR